MAEEQLSFQAEVTRLLDIVAHSLYSEKEVFLRELISNASDACDRLRYAALTQPDLLEDAPDFEIRLIVDQESRTLTVTDNGIGMNRSDLVENLGTIARSGSLDFLSKLGTDQHGDVSLIGQFGVGFYAAFMVADRVEVLSRRAGEPESWRWTSDGKGSFSIGEAAESLPRGTQVVLHLKEDAGDYLEETRLSRVIQTYSDHIGLPIRFGTGADARTLNKASALWTRSRNEITVDQYKEFYHHVSHAFDEPWLTLHWRAEGKLEYTGLLFVPSNKPFDLFDPRRSHRVKLYVRRVFITDEAEGLVPSWLRFLRGVIDSEDLPLNVSREMLQNNPVVTRIRAGLTKRVLGELEKTAADSENADAYRRFWTDFGAVVKEGLYEDSEHRDTLLKIARFRSTRGDQLISLDDYVAEMKEGQEAIYFLSGDDSETLVRSPQLEGFRARGVEVLFLTDPVDEFWVPIVGSYQDKALTSVTRAGVDLAKIATKDSAAGDGASAETTDETPAEGAGIDHLISLFKLTLGDAVKDVRTSVRLTDSAVCLVSDEGDMDIHLERLLKQHRQLSVGPAKRILELNPTHSLIRSLADRANTEGSGDTLADLAWLLLDQARIVEGEPPPDPSAFARRLAEALEKSLI